MAFAKWFDINKDYTRTIKDQVSDSVRPAPLISIAFLNYGITAHFLEHKLRNRPASFKRQ